MNIYDIKSNICFAVRSSGPRYLKATRLDLHSLNLCLASYSVMISGPMMAFGNTVDIHGT